MGTPPPPAANSHLSSALHTLAEWLTGQKIPYVLIGRVVAFETTVYTGCGYSGVFRPRQA